MCGGTGGEAVRCGGIVGEARWHGAVLRHGRQELPAQIEPALRRDLPGAQDDDDAGVLGDEVGMEQLGGGEGLSSWGMGGVGRREGLRTT